MTYNTHNGGGQRRGGVPGLIGLWFLMTEEHGRTRVEQQLKFDDPQWVLGEKEVDVAEWNPDTHRHEKVLDGSGRPTKMMKRNFIKLSDLRAMCEQLFGDVKGPPEFSTRSFRSYVGPEWKAHLTFLIHGDENCHYVLSEEEVRNAIIVMEAFVDVKSKVAPRTVQQPVSGADTGVTTDSAKENATEEVSNETVEVKSPEA